jgi:PhnB protein
MPVKPRPDGYHAVTPYLTVPGVASVLEFIERTFGAVTTERHGTPDGRVVHAEVRIGDSMLMFGEPHTPEQSRPSNLYVYVDDVDAVYKRALAAGARSVMEPADQFYGDRNAGVADSAGNQWWIAKHVEDVPPEEIERRAAEHAKKQGKH